jgi:hypothetical protein
MLRDYLRYVAKTNNLFNNRSQSVPSSIDINHSEYSDY